MKWQHLFSRDKIIDHSIVVVMNRLPTADLSLIFIFSLALVMYFIHTSASSLYPDAVHVRTSGGVVTGQRPPFVTLLSVWFPGQFAKSLNQYIRHYEGLSYDTEALHSSHQRAKRAISHRDKTLQLDFHSHGR